MFRPTLTRALLLSASLTALSAAQATTLEKRDFKSLVQDASACVVAETQSVDYEIRNGAPVTKTTFNVTKTAFGSTPASITVVTPGGKIPGAKISMAEVNAGVPRFFSGTGNVLLLDQAGGEYVISGFTEGVFDMFATPEGVMVRLPESQGGVTPVDDALEVINGARAAQTRPIEE